MFLGLGSFCHAGLLDRPAARHPALGSFRRADRLLRFARLPLPLSVASWLGRSLDGMAVVGGTCATEIPAVEAAATAEFMRDRVLRS
jgi:hypothetical protein